MEYIYKQGFQLSRLTIGTVQFGLPYGLKDNPTVISSSEVLKLLNYASSLGCNSIDTAAAYGCSEEKIGNWIKKSTQKAKKTVIITKIHDIDTTSETSTILSMRRAVLSSLEKLNINQISILMIHHFNEYLKNPNYFNKAFDVMKEEELIACSGVSAYSSDDYFKISDSNLDAVQIPINPLDWDQINSGGLRSLSNSNKLVFARSIYLQGLLLRDTCTLPRTMSFAYKAIEQYNNLCIHFGMTPKELAMSFALSLPEISSIVAGCRDMEQFSDNCNLIENCKYLLPEQMDLLRFSFSNIDKKIINPSLWNKPG